MPSPGSEGILLKVGSIVNLFARHYTRGDIAPYLPKIKRLYGVDVSDVPYGNLAGIFRKIKDAQKCRTASTKKKSPNQAL